VRQSTLIWPLLSVTFSDFLAVFMPIGIRKALFLMANKSPMFKKASG
jgi:hypothetical protein